MLFTPISTLLLGETATQTMYIYLVQAPCMKSRQIFSAYLSPVANLIARECNCYSLGQQMLSETKRLCLGQRYPGYFLCDFAKRCLLSFRLNTGIALVQASEAGKNPEGLSSCQVLRAQAQTYPWVGGFLVLCEDQGGREGRFCHFGQSFMLESSAKSENFSCGLGQPYHCGME